MTTTKAVFASKRDRVRIVVSGLWILFATVAALYYNDEYRGHTAQTAMVFVIVYMPVLLYWGYWWISSAPPDPETLKVAQERANAIQNALPLEPYSRPLGIKSHVIVLGALLLLAIFAEVYSLYAPTTLNSTFIIGAPLIGAWIVFLSAYHQIRKQLIKIGIQGLRVSTGWLVFWFMFPIANMIIPWLALGSLDRANHFAAKYGRTGTLWNQQGFRTFSWRAMLLALSYAALLGLAPQWRTGKDIHPDFGTMAMIWIVMAAVIFAGLSILYMLEQHRCLRAIADKLSRNNHNY